MALVLADRVLETTTTAGSGTITLAGAEPGYQSFSAVGDGNQTYYTIAGDTEWEVGIGTYTASGTTLSRDTVLSSSNSGAKVTFSAGVKKVFVTYPSEKSVNRDVSGNISASSGVITDVASPSAASDAATKLYVDSLVAAGITYHSPVKYEVPNSTGNLNATYNNGTAGVSATLTNAGTLAAFVPDGVTATISDRVLVYNQTNGFENGVYTVTVVGDGSTAWVLTRASDADTYALKSPNSLGEGDAFFVTSGDTGAGETYLCNTTGTIVFGSTAISFVQISSAQVYKAGTGISLTNTTISLVSPVAVATGGTGTTGTPTNGQLLIGNGSGYTLSTLTAGSGVSITNSAGSITLSATGLGGTVTAVTATGPLASSGGTTPDISIANSTGTGSVVLDQGATISSATITAALSASITTITGSSANITTVTGTTAGFSSAAITQLSGTSAGITTVSGTTTTFSSGTITQFGATSATITTLSGTSVSYPNASFTSATVTNLSSTSANITTLTGGSLTLTSNASITGALVVNGATYIFNDTFNIEGAAPIVTFRSTNASSGIRLNVAASATVAYRFSYANNELVRINPTGFVGILKTPSTALDVSGTITGTDGSFGSANVTTLTGTNFTASSLSVSNNIGLTNTGAPSITKTYSARVDLSSGGLGNPFWQGWHFATPDVIVVGGSNTFPRTSLYNAYSTATNPTDLAFTIMPGNNGAGNYALALGANGAEQVRITATGVGIGTASTGFNSFGLPLIVGSGSGNTGMTIYSGTTSYGSIHFADAVTTGADSFRGYINYIHSTNSMQFGTNAAERMRIDSSGNVGIGTTSPGAKLQVNGNTAQYSPSVAVRTPSNQYEWGHSNTSGYGSVIGAESGSGASFIAFNSGAGTNSNTYRTFGIPGSVFRADNAGGLGLYRVTTASADNQSLTGPTAFFDSSGNVGIGTTSPGVRLDVVGGRTNLAANSEVYALGVKYNSTTGPYYIGATNSGTPDLVFSQVGGTERFRFGNAGQLGIGGANYGTSGQVLTSNGSGSAPSWQTAGGLPAVNVTSSTAISAVAGNHYILRGASATVTLPSSPSAGNVVWITVANSLTVNKVARNGVNIQGLAEDLILNSRYAAVQLRYSDATMGWIFC